jgi:hypothetical protein
MPISLLSRVSLEPGRWRQASVEGIQRGKREGGERGRSGEGGPPF